MWVICQLRKTVLPIPLWQEVLVTNAPPAATLAGSKADSCDGF